MVIPICRFRRLKSVHAPPLCICYTCPWLKSRCTRKRPHPRPIAPRITPQRLRIPTGASQAGNHALRGTFHATAVSYGLHTDYKARNRPLQRRFSRLESLSIPNRYLAPLQQSNAVSVPENKHSPPSKTALKGTHPPPPIFIVCLCAGTGWNDPLVVPFHCPVRHPGGTPPSPAPTVDGL